MRGRLSPTPSVIVPLDSFLPSSMGFLREAFEAVLEDSVLLCC